MTTSGRSLDGLGHYGSDLGIYDYRFDVSSIEGDIAEDFDGEEGKEDSAQDEERERAKREKSTVEEESAWNVDSDRSDEGEKYGGAFYEEEEVGEAEEEIPLSPTVSTTEKFEEEVRQVEESDHVLAEIPAEVSADRDAIISRLKELQSELSDSRRKNRLLEIWVHRYMKKTQQRMTASDRVRDAEKTEQMYKEALRSYKMQVDEIQTQQAELTYEMDNYARKVEDMRQEDTDVFNEFLDREKEVAVDLIFSKTGKKITEKIMNILTRRQMTRRGILARDRQSYVRLQHRLEDIIAGLRLVETLGEGMTTMDYEALHVANIGFKDKLDERDQELEKLRFKIADTVNGVAHFKEKEVCIVEDIEHEERALKDHREKNTRIREKVNVVHSTLNEIRDTYNEKKLGAGLMVSQQALLEMEIMMKQRDDLKKSIGKIEHEIRQYGPAKQMLQKKSFNASRETIFF